MGYDNPEGIRQALGDEELMFTVAQVITATINDPDGITAQLLAEGVLTEEQVGQTAAVIVTHEMGRFYPGALRAIGSRGLQISKLLSPDKPESCE